MTISKLCAIVAILIVVATISANYDAWVRAPKLREGLTRSLVDADSAQFRGERVASNGTIICGEFNSKNRMGGYGGFRRYISTAGSAFAVEGESLATWDSSTDAIMASLQAKAGALKSARANGSEVADFKIEADVNRRLFDSLWEKHCS